MSRLMFGTEDRHQEMRVRITVEGVLNRKKYLDNFYLRSGIGSQTHRPTDYDLLSLYIALGGEYNEMNNEDDINRIYNGDVKAFSNDKAYGGMFQVCFCNVI